MSFMPIGRITEICSGHKCYPPTVSVSGSSNVFSDDLPVHRVSDMYVPHCCKTCHPVITSKASPSVYANDLACSHIGSSTSCSSKNIMMTGSSTVWVEGA